MFNGVVSAGKKKNVHPLGRGSPDNAAAFAGTWARRRLAANLVESAPANRHISGPMNDGSPRIRLKGCTALRVIGAAAALLGLGGCGRGPSIRPLAVDAVVVAFGDSLTRGTGAAEGEDYPSVLAQLSGWTVVNAGVPGERTDAGLRRLPAVIEEHRPGLVILCEGGNDLLGNAAHESVARNLAAMIELLQAQGIDVILLGVPEKGLLLSSPDLYADLADRYGIPCDDETIPEILSRNALKSDYIHPNAQGYGVLAEAVWKLLRDAQR